MPSILRSSAIRLFLVLGVVFVCFLGLKMTAEYHYLGVMQAEMRLDEARVLRNFFLAYRQAYQEAFLSGEAELNEHTAPLLPAAMARRISQDFIRRTGRTIRVATVSDRPRNPDNMAKGPELAAIRYFQANPNATEYEEVVVVDGEERYFYASPLRVTRICLSCHGDPGEILPSVASRYTKALGYRPGDLRGILAIHMGPQRHHYQLLKVFQARSLASTLLLGIASLLAAWYLLHRLRRSEAQYTRNLESEVARRVRELLAKERQIQSLLTQDQLTGLPNRLSLLRDLANHPHGSLMIVDIHDFGSINDFYGIEVGDAVLQEFGRRVRHWCRTLDVDIYRSHADQLALVPREDWRIEEFERLCRELVREVCTRPFVVDEHEIYLQITCGLAYHRKNPLIEADIALEEAKRKRLYFHAIQETWEIQQNLAEKHSWIHRVQTGLDQERIVPFFQPIVSAADGRIAKYECLVRLIESGGKVISPAAFLDIARQGRLYPQITRAVVAHAAEVFSAQDLDMDFSINLLSEDIMDLATLQLIRERLVHSPLSRRVIFEILETEGLQHFEQMAAFIQEVKQHGCRIAIDDFGTGYSNFERLLNLQVDYLKIDGSIIRKIATDDVSATIARTIVVVARELGVQTVAEFVHDQATADLARDMGIDYLQGYYYGPPQPHPAGPPE